MSLALLKKACLNCKPSSIKTYWANIKALAKVAGREEIPSGAAWLSDALLKRVEAMPLNRFKRFTTAGVKAAQMYGTKRPKWSKAMSTATDRYAKIRESGKRTKRESDNWPEGGYKALENLAKTLRSELEHLQRKKKWNTRDLYHFQRYLIVAFYSRFALRGDLADVRIKKPLGANYLLKKGSSYELHVGEHKTSWAHGAIKLKIDGELAEALKTFLPQVNRLTNHGFLLSTLRTGNRMQRQDMLKLIRNITRERLGKNIGVQLIRVLKVSASQKEIDKAAQLQAELGHSSTMQRKYISRDQPQ